MTPKEIKDIIERFSGVDLSSKSRKLDIVSMKSIYCKVCRDYGKNLYGNSLSYADIGKEIGIDHTTVMHHCNKTSENFIANNQNVKMIYNSFKDFRVNSNNPKISEADNSDVIQNKMQSKILRLEKENRILKDKGDDVIRDILNIICEVPEDRLETLLTRLRPMAKMITKAKYNYEQRS